MSSRFLTDAERIWIVQVYNETRSPKQVIARWPFPSPHPSKHSILYAVANFRATGSVKTKVGVLRKPYPRIPLSQLNINSVTNLYNQSPKVSVRQAGRILGMSKSTVQATLKKTGTKGFPTNMGPGTKSWRSTQKALFLHVDVTTVYGHSRLYRRNMVVRRGDIQYERDSQQKERSNLGPPESTRQEVGGNERGFKVSKSKKK